MCSPPSMSRFDPCDVIHQKKRKWDSQQLTEDGINYHILQWMKTFEENFHFSWVNCHRHFQPFENLTWQKIDPFIFKASTMIGTLISISMFDTMAFSLLFIILVQDDPNSILCLLEMESKSWVVLQPKVPAYFRGKQVNKLMGRPPSPPRELI